jgi:hypothetical protein
MEEEAKADRPVRMEVGCIFGDVVENVRLTFVDIEDGCFEVDGGPKVVVVGQFVWVDENVGWERVESMERTGNGKRRKGETRDEGRVKTR